MLTKTNVAYIAPESTPNANPDADGSDFVYVPTTELSLISDLGEILETNFQTGRGYRTAHEFGAQGWRISAKIPFWCMSSSAGTSVSASTIDDDFLDVLLNHIFGAHANTSGVGLTSGAAGASVLVADTSGFSLQQCLLASFTDAATRGHYAQITATASAPTYSIAPPWKSTITTNWQALGAHVWQPTLSLATSLALFFKQGTQWYSLTGGKVTSAQINCVLNKPYSLDVTIEGISKSRVSAPASLPAAVPPTYARLRHSQAPVYFGSTELDNAGWTFDFGLQTAPIESSGLAEGRAQIETIGFEPKLTIKPFWSSTIEDWKSSATKAQITLGLGSGIQATSRANGASLIVPGMQIVSNDAGDDGGRVKQDLEFALADQIYPAADATASARIFSLSRY